MKILLKHMRNHHEKGQKGSVLSLETILRNVKNLTVFNRKLDFQMKILPLLFFLTGSFHLQAQPCDVEATASSVDILCGDTIRLNAIGTGETVFDNDFDGCNSGPSNTWAFAQNARYDDPCGDSPNGSCYLWFGDASPAPRRLETFDLALTTGGTIKWTMRYARQGNPSPCEGPDLPEEGVSLQYSTNSGATWKTIMYYPPNGGTDAFRTNWNQYSEGVPADANNTTRIRWYQINASGAGNDHWGIENIEIIRNPPTAFYVWQDIGVQQPNGLHPDVSPTATTTYTVEYHQEQPDGSFCVATDAVTVNVVKPTIAIQQDPIGPLCPGENTELIVTSDFDPPIPSCGLSPTGCQGVSTRLDAGTGAVNNGNYLVVGQGTTAGFSLCSNGSGNHTRASRTQYIIRRSELPATYRGGQIYSIDLRASGAVSLPNLSISVGCTSDAQFNGSAAGDFHGGLVEVYNGTTNFVAGWNTVDFTNHYDYDGVSNIVIQICVRDGANLDGDLQKTNVGWNAVVNTETCTDQGSCGFYLAGTALTDQNRPSTRLGVCYRPIPDVTYSWTPATDIDDASNDTVNVTPPASTTYTVTVMNQNINPACAVSESVDIEIAPLGNFTPTYNDPLCEGDDLELYGNLAGMGTYEWKDPTGTVIGNTEDVTVAAVTPADAGTYTLYITNGTCDNTVTLDVEISDKGDAGIARDTAMCQNDGAMNLLQLLTDSDAGGVWLDDDATGKLSGASFDPATMDPASLPATFAFTYELDLCGISTATVNVTVNPKPEPPGVVSPLDYCKDSITSPLTAAGSNLNWYVDAGLNTLHADQPPTPSSAVPGRPAETHFVTQTVAGCESDPANIEININEAPTITLDSKECNGLGTQYRVTVTLAGGDPGSYELDNGSGFASVGGGSYTTGWINSGDPFTLTLKDQFDCSPAVLTGTHDCDCLTHAGAMENTTDTINLCLDEEYDFSAHHNATDFFLDADDVAEYIVHDNLGTIQDIIVARNSNGNFGFDNNTMTKEVVYYVSRAAASDADSNGELDFDDGCLDYTLGVPVVWHDIPTASLPADMFACSGEDLLVSIDVEETPDFSLKLDTGIGVYSTPFFTNAPFEISFPNITANKTVELISVENEFGCASDINTSMDITITDKTVVALDSMVCAPDGQSFIVYISISGGTAPYSYTSSTGHTGTFNAGDSQFISDLIPSETAFSFTFEDLAGSPCNNGDLTIADSRKCDCLSAVGTLSIQGGLNTLQLCAGEYSIQASYSQTGEFFDADDARAFYLHTTNNLGGTGDVVLDGPKTTETQFTYIPGVTNFGTTYYISAVVGNAQGSGVDYNEICAVSSPIPVKFLDAPDVSISAPLTACLEDGYTVDLSFTGTGPYNITGTANIEGEYAADSSVPISPASSGTITLNITEIDNGVCSRVKSNGVTTEVEESPKADTQTLPLHICNGTNTAYQVQFQIIGKPGDYEVIGSDGNGMDITGVVDASTPPIYLSDEIASGLSYNLSLRDKAIICTPTEISGDHTCDCETAVGSVSGILETTPLCGLEIISTDYDNTNENFDADDVTSFVFSSTQDESGAILHNATGVFDLSASITAGDVEYNTSYYVIAVTGNNTGGLVDFNDPCLQVSNAFEVKLFPEPSGILSSLDNIICFNSSVGLDLEFTGTNDARFTAYMSTSLTENITETGLSAPTDQVSYIPNQTGAIQITLDSILDETSGCVARELNTNIFGVVNITVNPSPSVDILGSQSFCFDNNGNMAPLAFENFTGAAPFDVYYSDNLGNNFTFVSDGTNAVENVGIANNPYTLTSTTFQVDSILDQSPEQCKGTSPATVQFNVQPIPDLDLSLSELVICAGSISLPLGDNTIGTGGITATLDGPTYSDTQTGLENADLNFVGIGNTPGTFVYSITNLVDNSPLACSNTDSVYSVNLEVRPQPTVLPYFNQPELCHGDSIQLFFTVTGSGPISFDYSNGLGVSGSATFPAGGGQYVWIHPSNVSTSVSNQVFTVFNIQEDGGIACPGVSNGNANLQVNPLPIGTISIDDGEICFGESANLLFNGVGNGPLTYVYSNGQSQLSTVGAAGTAESVSISPLDNTNYILLEIRDNSNPTCINTNPNSQTDIIVNPLPQGVISGMDEICFGESFEFNVSLTGNAPFDIVVSDFNGNQEGSFTGLFSGNNNLVITPTVSLSYYLSEIVDAKGCTNSGTGLANNVVNPNPEPSFVGDNLASCPPFQTTFINTTPAQFIGPGSTISWDFGNGTTSDQIQPPAVDYLDKDGRLYSVRLHVESDKGCIGISDSVAYIEAYAMPIPDFISQPAKPDVINPNVLFQNTSEGGSTYNWTFHNPKDSSVFGTNEFSPWYNFPPEELRHEVCLEAISEHLCKDTICRPIDVKDILLVNIPNTFTPNGDGENDIFKAIVSGFNPELNGFQMYIFNRWGEQIFESTDPDNGWDGRFKGNNTPVDVYLYRVIVKSKNSTDKQDITGHIQLLR